MYKVGKSVIAGLMAGGLFLAGSLAAAAAGSGNMVNGTAAGAADIVQETAVFMRDEAEDMAKAAAAEAEAKAAAEEEAAAAAAAAEAEPEEIRLDESWEFADYSKIHDGAAVLYKAPANRKNITIGVNAGHGTQGGNSVKTYCHPDQSAKTTGGSTSAGSIEATAVSSGMTMHDGTPEHAATLDVARTLRDLLLENGYDVLMVRDGEDVQLDNIARTVICNNTADCHIAIHFDGDGLSYDKGAFYISVPDGIKNMYPVSDNWQACDELGENLTEGLASAGVDIYGNGSMQIDLTQTSYSTIPSVDIELGNAATNLTDERIEQYAEGLLKGIEEYPFEESLPEQGAEDMQQGSEQSSEQD